MGSYLLLALDWSEVWALLIPLTAFGLKRKQPVNMRPVILYLFIALAINIVIDFIMAFNVYNKSFTVSNNPLYNIHSIARFACFSLFFLKRTQTTFGYLRYILVIVFILFLAINFGVYENFMNAEYLSGNLLTAESYLLLIYCMQYYLYELRSDDDNLFNGPDFWTVTGLSIYLVINFFVFLFYVPMLTTNPTVATNIWNLHNISFILFCIFLTKALYVTAGNKYSV